MRTTKARTCRLLLALAVVGVLTGMAAASSANADGNGVKFKPRTLAKKHLIAAHGGRVRTHNGVELRVPAGVMRRNGVGSIRQLPRGRFKLHISVRWKGTVTVMLPVGKRKVRGVAHFARGRWIVEPATMVKGRARLRVRNLSEFDTTEAKRYATETMNLPYTAFIARKADFGAAGCDPQEPKPWGYCRKPSPYHRFDWADDSCSPSWVPSLFYRDLFDEPCQQHDFGYRNYGNGLRLGREWRTRAWIDRRFLEEMTRVCRRKFLQALTCLQKAGAVWAVVSGVPGHRAFFGPVPHPEPGRPLPETHEPIAPLPPLDHQPQTPLELVPPPPSQPQPQQPPPSPQAQGFTIEDVFLGGTWARTDPNNGTWYSKGNRPANAAYWYPNGLGVGVDCARAAAGYIVRFADGHSETWNTWFHVTDGKWFPSAAARETRANGFYGLQGC